MGRPADAYDWLMVVDNGSKTASFAAQVRAAHALLDPDPIFVDPYALSLAGVPEAEVRDLFGAIPETCARVARVLPNQRARLVDEEVERAVHRGVGQFVILGAGLDSFAWRRADMAAVIEVFEVDHPATQSWKQERMTAAGLSAPSGLHFAGVDLAAVGQLAKGLTAVGFDPDSPTVWSWMGVIVYLSVEAVDLTLRTVRELSGPGSRLVASYAVTRELMDSDSREFDDLARASSASGGEPHVTFLAPQEIENMARLANWSTVHSVDPSTLAPWFANRTDGLGPMSYEWFLVADA
jgi:methyltransferase (TIGR00027 family)